ncbi:acyl-CoA dehydrogenase family protein [Microbacterium sp. X-17]|uniref:acyl-CoA dehydrogenase family protein n=1 Tax=Microbacterium sp. X-17 TaxID=3144404 RepID=UPI0031F4949E
MSATNDEEQYERLAREFFAGTITPRRVTEAEDVVLDEELWSEIQEMGMPLIGIPEERGGAGGDLPALVGILRAAGAAAVPAPVAETQLATWAITAAGLELPDAERPLTVFPGDPRDTWTFANGVLTGRFHGVPWARAASHAVALLALDGRETRLVIVPLEGTRIEAGYDLARQPKDVVEVASAVEVAAWDDHPDALRSLFILSRSALMAGAIEEIANLTRAYVTEREQFGRPIGKFQSVQEHVVRLEQMATMSLLAVDRAVGALTRSPGSLEVSLVKLLLNENARVAVRAAHQAHGAIGMTQEYRLQLLTRRLNSWLGETGTTVELAPIVGRAAELTGVSALINAPGVTGEPA